MHARGVVPALDVAKHAVLGIDAGGKVLPMSFLNLQRMPEALDRRIVKAVARAAHGLAHCSLNQPLTYLCAGVLATAIRVEDQSRPRFSGCVSHLQSVQHQLPHHVFGNRPAHDPAREQIENRAHVYTPPPPSGSGSTGTWPINVSGNATRLATGNFSVLEADGKLIFKCGSTVIASMSSAGVLSSLGNVASNSTP